VTKKSKGFCDRVQEIKIGIERASAVVVTAVPSSADAQADFLSWVSGVSPTMISRLMPAWFVIALELVAMTSFIFAAAEDATFLAKKVVKRKKRKTPKRPRSGSPALKVVSNG
jgi:hypothetical protein